MNNFLEFPYGFFRSLFVQNVARLFNTNIIFFLCSIFILYRRKNVKIFWISMNFMNIINPGGKKKQCSRLQQPKLLHIKEFSFIKFDDFSRSLYCFIIVTIYDHFYLMGSLLIFQIMFCTMRQMSCTIKYILTSYLHAL